MCPRHNLKQAPLVSRINHNLHTNGYMKLMNKFLLNMSYMMKVLRCTHIVSSMYMTRETVFQMRLCIVSVTARSIHAS